MSIQESPRPVMRWWALAIVMIGTFMGGLDTYIINVSLPTIRDSFGSEVAVIQWVPLAYLVAITGSLVIFGRASDLWGSRRLYIAGLLTFVLGSALAGAAPSAWSLVAFRGLQGLGAAMLLASGQSLLAEVFPEQQRGRAMAFMHVAVALGFTSGPSVGGLMVETVGWRWIFYVNVPVGLLAAAVAFRVLPSARREQRRGFDPTSAITLMAGLVLTLVALTRMQQEALGVASVLLVAGVGLLVAFLIVERRSVQPILDLWLFRHRAFTAGLLAAFFNFIAMASNMFLIPFFLQLQLGMSPARAGLIMMAVPVTILWAAPVGGWLSDRLGPRLPATAGLGLVTAAVFSMAALSGGASGLDMIAVLTLYGLGAALFQAPKTAAFWEPCHGSDWGQPQARWRLCGRWDRWQA